LQSLLSYCVNLTSKWSSDQVSEPRDVQVNQLQSRQTSSVNMNLTQQYTAVARYPSLTAYDCTVATLFYYCKLSLNSI